MLARMMSLRFHLVGRPRTEEPKRSLNEIH
jgi:hypothetical protein